VAWAVLLPRASALAAGALRLRGDVRVREEEEELLWLRGEDLGEELDLELRKLPGARRHTVDGDGRFTEVGHRIPAGTLPSNGWKPLSTWLSPGPQPAALAGDVPQRVVLRVERTGVERPASVLLTSVEAWAAYARRAPAARLRPLTFAACADGRTIVRGAPLPPVPGRRYAEREGVAVPCGYAWSPPVEPAVVRQVLRLAAGDLALFAGDGTHERVDAAHFARATRAAARASLEALRP
jgi:hypothetical protein